MAEKFSTNGLRFTGFKQPERREMSEERKSLRATMTDREKQLESYLNYRHKNLERVRATQRAYQARKRAAAAEPQVTQ
jgi:hypothetical protein